MSEVWFYGYGNTASKACEILVENKHHVRVFTPSYNQLKVTADNLGLPCTNYDHYSEIDSLPEPEIIISFLFPTIIPKEVLSKSKYGGINFHPAPLPQYRGVHCAAFAILNKESSYGITCHYMTEHFDNGPIIGQKTCLLSTNDTEISLEIRAKRILLTLYQEIVTQTLWKLIDPELLYWPQKGILHTKKMYESERVIKYRDNKEIPLYARAFWYPPKSAAILKRGSSICYLMPKNNQKFQCIDETELKEINF